MNRGRWRETGRLALGFLVAPAIAPLTCVVLLIGVVSMRNVDCPAGAAMFLRGIVCAGIPASYICAALVGLPYVLWMRRRGELNLWTLMTPILGLVLPLVVLLSVIVAAIDLMAGVLVLLPLTGVVLSVLCFHFLTARRCA